MTRAVILKKQPENVKNFFIHFYKYFSTAYNVNVHMSCQNLISFYCAYNIPRISMKYLLKIYSCVDTIEVFGWFVICSLIKKDSRLF